jgi:hypothetical protein
MPSPRVLLRVAGAALLLCLVACDRDRETGKKSGATTSRAVTTGPAGNGVIRGVVRFKGTPPEGERIDGSRCHAGAADIDVVAVTVGEGGALKDVVVYVKDPSAAPSAKGDPVVLDQVGCRYVPRALALRTGQVLRVKSSDPTVHNVHALSRDNPAVNFGMTGAGQTRDLTFAAPERIVVKCDVHPWMSAHVYVLDHPYFAVTGDDGRFEIKGLPAGPQTVVFSHPFLGDRERTVDPAADGAAADVEVTFEKGANKI